MLRYGYFDSEIIGVDQEGMPIFDRAELSDLFALLLASLVSDGVLAQPATCFKIQAAGNGLAIERLPGFGMVKGHFCYDEESDIMKLEPAPQKYSRIDRVVIRLNRLDRMVEIVIKTGAEAARPEPPELVRPSAGDYYELCLASIRLSAGQKLLTQSSITDTRADSSVCGYITQLIAHLDTSVFFAQFEQFYREFVERSDGSYSQFVNDMQKYLDGLASSGDSQLQEIVKTLTDFEAGSEQQWKDWFNSIKQALESVENGEMLEELMQLVNALYDFVTYDDIKRIIEGTYEETDEAGSVQFVSVTRDDITAIINGNYVESSEDETAGGGTAGNESISGQDIENIVDSAFSNI